MSSKTINISEFFKLGKKLFPICRSLTGNGNRKEYSFLSPPSSETSFAHLKTSIISELSKITGHLPDGVVITCFGNLYLIVEALRYGSYLIFLFFLAKLTPTQYDRYQ